LLSNRSHLIYLPSHLTFPEFKGSHQFMAMLSSPEAEDIFCELKARFGSLHLWHGSHGQRWHSIFRTGLKNATGTKLQVNGAAHGEGIYLAAEAGTSWGYSHPAPNKYRNSALGGSLHIISLCEVAKVPDKGVKIDIQPAGKPKMTCAGFLKEHGWCHTLTMEQACVVRFLMVGGGFQENERTG
jgi:hypothetical protein